MPFVQLHLFIAVLLASAGVSVALQPHKFAGQMDLLSMTAMSVIMFLSLYYINYAQQPSGAQRPIVACTVFMRPRTLLCSSAPATVYAAAVTPARFSANVQRVVAII